MGWKYCKDRKEKPMLLSKCVACGIKIARFIKEQGNSRLLSRLGIKLPILSYISLVGDVLF